MTPEAKHYKDLLAASRKAIRARDSIENCLSAEWRAAHAVAREAAMAADREMKRLAKADRLNGLGWMGPAERELILKGYI